MLLLNETSTSGSVRLREILSRYRLEFSLLPIDADIPGSHWGAPEAGLIGSTLFARPDTPLHSILHEACHFVCMDASRRKKLHTDASGSAVEESAVCYLSILLSDQLPEFQRSAMFTDMDAWGYSFRLGSAGRWFNEDAEDAQQWLLEQGLVDSDNQPSWNLRET
jgi:hypothetical protein